MKEKTGKNSIKQKKDNILKSLQEVENFLQNLKKVSKGAKIYKILKK